MWWSGLFRRLRRGRSVSEPVAAVSIRPAWAEVALPPPEAIGEVAATANMFGAADSRPTVRLGFADGTSVEIDDGSGPSEALRAMASRLLRPTDS